MDESERRNYIYISRDDGEASTDSGTVEEIDTTVGKSRDSRPLDWLCREDLGNAGNQV